MLCPSLSAAAPPDTEAAALDEEQSDGEEEGEDVQAVVLVPGELVGLHPQVLGSVVSHGELDPEHGFVQRADGSVMVDAGQPQGVLLVPGNTAM